MRIPDATERKVIVACFAVSAVICLCPGDLVSAGILFVIAMGLAFVHTRLSESEKPLARVAPADDDGAAVLPAPLLETEAPAPEASPDQASVESASVESTSVEGQTASVETETEASGSR